MFRDVAKNRICHVHADGSNDRYGYDRHGNLLKHILPDHRMVYYASLVSAYKLVDGEGDISTDFESQEVMRRMLTALIKYFSDNNLLVEGRGRVLLVEPIMGVILLMMVLSC